MKAILFILLSAFSAVASSQTTPFIVFGGDGVSRMYIDAANASLFGDGNTATLLAVGYHRNWLTTNHQVGVYVPLEGNSYTNGDYGYVIGYETSLGTAPGNYTVGHVVGLNLGGVSKGAGSTITRTLGIQMADETVGMNNAFVSDWGNTFTGNWFINYNGTRPIHTNGDLILGDSAHVPIMRFAAYPPYTSEGVIYRSGNNLLIATTNIGTRMSIDLGTGAVSIPGLGYGGGTLSIGPSDSGGTGYRIVRVPN